LKSIRAIPAGREMKVRMTGSSLPKKTAAELELKFKHRLFYIKCDINKLDEIRTAMEATEKQFGPIDILVNNCGGPSPGFFDDLDEEKWRRKILIKIVPHQKEEQQQITLYL